MGCGCLIALLAMASPRGALFFVSLFGDRMSVAFTSFWIAVVGFLFLPWTTLAWAFACQPVRGVTGFGWIIVAFALFVDLSSYAGSARARRERAAT